MENYIPRFMELSGLCAIIYLVGYCYRGASWPKSIFKTGSILALAVAAGFSAPIWLPVGLIFCATGDYLLSNENARDFLRGIGAFAMGHIFLTILFLTTPAASFDLLQSAPRVAILCLFALIVFCMLLLLWGRTGTLRYPVFAYIAIIAVMAIAAATLPWEGFYGSVLVGVALFVLSDLVLAIELFLISDTGTFRKMTPFMVWSLYWTAQLLITVGFVFQSLDV